VNKILFIENRQKTKLYEAISERLIHESEIHWLVQNHAFTPNLPRVNIISYPSKNQRKKSCKQASLEHIIESDRQQQFFGKKGAGYFFYYYEEIEKILNCVKPDIIFGEATAFHELITIELCKHKSILYLNPSTCRYPRGRFCFYKHDTLEPYMGSNEQYSQSKLQKTISQINRNEVVPDYMKIKQKGVVEKLKNHGLIFLGRLTGERYNTPGVFKKCILELKKKKLKKRWDAISCKTKIKEKSVLYPLQMQPEANIDVWGRQHRNQLETIKLIYAALPKDATLYVKPNPKLKYEVSDSMITYILKTPRVVAIPTYINMKDVVDDIGVVVTVTGTIALERIFSEKPVITLVKTLNNTASICKFAKDHGKLHELIYNALISKQYQTGPKGKYQFLNSVVKKSYVGKISDPYSDYTCLSAENINNLSNAFNAVINNVT
jgi:hypothetical protein